MRRGEMVGSERQGERESGKMAPLGCSPHARWGFIRPGARCREDPADSRPTAGLEPGLHAGRNGGLREWNGVLLESLFDFTGLIILGTASRKGASVTLRVEGI